MTASHLRSLSLILLLAGRIAAQSGPVIVNTSFPPGAVGVQYAQGLSVSGGAAPYTWTITSGGLPPGLSVYTFGVISGIPSSGGTYPFTLTVTDSRQQFSSHAFSIVISGPTFAITTTSPLPAGAVGQNYNPVTLTANGGNAPLTWTVGQGFPPGLSLSAAGVISGTPTTAGSYSFPVQATDATQKTATATLAITIGIAPLTITTLPPLFAGSVGQSYAQTFTASGGRLPYTWSISGSLPAGLTINPSTGAVTGIPTAAGTSTFAVQVADSASATAQQSFSITINPPSLNLIVVSAVPSGTVGVSYAQKLPVTASGGTPPYTWSLTNGSVPGLVFDPVAVALNGTPTTPGTFNLTLQVADSAGLTASKGLSVIIAPATLGITTARQLPDGALNQPYSVTLAATGGAPPYVWSATGLPLGLSLNSATGSLSGAPAAAGSFGIALTVQDTTLSQFSDRFTLNVSLPAVPAVTLSRPAPAYGGPGDPIIPLTVVLASAYPADYHRTVDPDFLTRYRTRRPDHPIRFGWHDRQLHHCHRHHLWGRQYSAGCANRDRRRRPDDFGAFAGGRNRYHPQPRACHFHADSRGCAGD